MSPGDGPAQPATLSRVLNDEAASLAAEVAERLCGRAATVFRARGMGATIQLLELFIAALQGDVAEGSATHLRATLRAALEQVTDDSISFRDAKILGETLRAALHARCEAHAVPASALRAIDSWCIELAFQLGLRLVNQRDELINRQAAEIEQKLAEQRQLNHLVGELREEIRESKELGQYTLQAKIGEGGMGIVYRARHALLRRPTAVKLLSPERTREEDLRRFEREVRLTARLTHPNTVTIFDFGRTPQGVFYYAMEMLEGGTLEDVVEVDGAQPAARVAQVLQMVAGALAEAHGIGLIHRDIKPANIMLCEKGGEHDVAKVLDFGLVKDLHADPGAALSQTSQITGTPYYMSPEAIVDAQRVDARSDLYSLGAVGYFFLTGHNVFEGRTSIEVLSQHLHKEPVSPSQRLGRQVPANLEAILLSCLKKDPAQRPESAAEVRHKLRACTNLGTWDLAEARTWWERHAQAVRALHVHSEEIAVAKTVDINLHVLRGS